LELKDLFPYQKHSATYRYPELNEPSLHPAILFLLSRILSLFSHLCEGLSSTFFVFCFPTENPFTFLFSPICVTCPAHITPIDLIILIFGEAYQSWSFLNSNLLDHPDIFPHQAKVHSSALYSKIPSVYITINICTYRGADKSLARIWMKQTKKHVRDVLDLNNIEKRVVIKLLFLQGKAPKKIHAILTETLTCFLPGRSKDLSAPLYEELYGKYEKIVLSRHDSNTSPRVRALLKQDIFSYWAGEVLAGDETRF